MSTKPSSIFYTRHDGGLTIMKDGKQSTVTSTHQNFQAILDALKSKEYDKLETLMSIEKSINKGGVSKRNPGSKIFVRNGAVFFTDTRNRKEIELHGTLVDRILSDITKPDCGKFADGLMALLENIQLNKLKDISTELYDWLASGKNPITSDGCVLAYKKVRSDFFDQFSGTMDNSPGKVVRMNQKDVDTNRLNECSHGLHFASLGYLSRYSAGSDSKIVVVKVNPRHIFAIPKDYNCQKGRASEYFVVGEYQSKDKELMEAFSDSFVDEDNIEVSAPSVVLTKQGLKPSLKAIAESYGLVKDGKVLVTVADKKAITWMNPKGLEVTSMSFETKSVREAVQIAVDKFENV